MALFLISTPFSARPRTTNIATLSAIMQLDSNLIFIFHTEMQFMAEYATKINISLIKVRKI